MSETLEIETASPAAFRKAMGAFATGVAILTTEHEGTLYGLTVNSLTSVSLEPCTLLVCMKTGSGAGRAVRQSGRFGVSILSCQQTELSRRFCGPAQDRFAEVDLIRDESGLPFIAGATGRLACRLLDIYRSGDHDVFFGQVWRCDSLDERPLVFLGGRFGTFAQWT